MDILTYIICIIGVYLLGYKDHCEAADRYLNQVHSEALEEHFHRTEEHIRELHHNNGHVFNRGK